MTSRAPVDKLALPDRGGSMAAKVISVSNMKGGVGKTTITVALAHAIAKGGSRVLVVDLDAQANASFWLCGHVKLTAAMEQARTIDAFFEDAVVLGKPATLANTILPAKVVPERLSVIPASPHLRIVERELIVHLSRRQRNLMEVERVVSDLLAEHMQQLRTQYDVIIFDTAPGISALTESALRESHVVIIPTVPDFISNLGLLSFCRTVSWSNSDVANATKRTPWVVANKVRDTKHHQLMLQQMRTEASGADPEFAMFRTEVPNSARMEETASDLDSDGAMQMAPEDQRTFAALATEVLTVAEQNARAAAAA